MKRLFPLILSVLLFLAGCSSTPDLNEPEKVAFEYCKAAFLHYNQQKLNSMLSANSAEDTEVYGHFKPTKPGKVWITSKLVGDRALVYIYFSPGMHAGGLLKELTLVNDGKWRVYFLQGIKGTQNLDFKSFQGTPQYRELFGDIEWKEVEMQ